MKHKSSLIVCFLATTVVCGLAVAGQPRSLEGCIAECISDRDAQENLASCTQTKFREETRKNAASGKAKCTGYGNDYFECNMCADSVCHDYQKKVDSIDKVWGRIVGERAEKLKAYKKTLHGCQIAKGETCNKLRKKVEEECSALMTERRSQIDDEFKKCKIQCKRDWSIP